MLGNGKAPDLRDVIVRSTSVHGRVIHGDKILPHIVSLKRVEGVHQVPLDVLCRDVAQDERVALLRPSTAQTLHFGLLGTAWDGRADGASHVGAIKMVAD
eukprot:scaffold5808_cov128-Isochrysis_galbana.AAC.11